MKPINQRFFSFNFSSTAWEWFSFLICLCCLALFVVSAYDKIVDHERFVKGLVKVKYVGIYADFVSWSVPIAEILVSMLLLYPPMQKLGIYGFIGLMTVFTLYIGSMLLWAEGLPCYCNLVIEKLSFGQHLAFNMFFIGLALFALWLVKNKDYNF